MWGTPLYSKKLANNHFWLGTIGIILYAVPLYWAGFSQEYHVEDIYTEEGQLKFQFLETVTTHYSHVCYPQCWRVLYLVGAFLMVFNLYKTIAKGKFIANEAAEAAPLQKPDRSRAVNTGTGG